MFYVLTLDKDAPSNIMRGINPTEEKDEIMNLENLIAKIRDAATRDELFAAYTVGRVEAKLAGRMDDLLDAYEAADARLGQAPIMPLVKFG